MTLRRYHAARAERINKQEATEEAKQEIVYERKGVDIEKDEDTPTVEKRKYTKKTY